MPAWLILFVCALSVASAHPMGNFSVSHYSRIETTRDGIRLHYVLDLAEIPSFELMQSWHLKEGAVLSEIDDHTMQQARAWVKKLRIESGGKPMVPTIEDARLTMSDGAANMSVLRFDMWLLAHGQPGAVSFQDLNYPERAGWKEVIVVAGDGTRLSGNPPSGLDRSSALSAYPTDVSIPPPQVTSTAFEWSTLSGVALPRRESEQNGPKTPASETEITERTPEQKPPAAPPEMQQRSVPRPVVPPQVPAAGTVVRGDFLSDLLGRKDIGLSLMITGMLVAFGLGAMHALSPGHGKTMVAAYLVGSRGTPKHAMILGAAVTFTHTISVFLLGFVTLFLSRYILPETLYPVLGAISGLTIVWVGVSLFYRRYRRLLLPSYPQHHHHHHPHDHEHDHHHHHGPGGHTHAPEGEVTLGSLLALGASGGLVPCPSGLVLLLSSIALGRIALGLVLLTAFSAGLAVILTTIGVAVVYAKKWIPEPRRASQSSMLRLVPVLSAAVIVVVGIVMTAVSLGLVPASRLVS